MVVEQVLEDGDVPAELAALELARAEERDPERAERPAGADVGDPGDLEVVAALERAHGGERPRADDRVDRAEVEALRAQRDLESCVLRIQRRPRERPPQGLPRAPPRMPSRKRIGLPNYPASAEIPPALC